MKMILGCPVIDNKEYTRDATNNIINTVKNTKDFKFVIVDNGSKKPYKTFSGKTPVSIDIISNKSNRGYYYPLLQLYKKYPKADIIALIHNDVRIHESGWDIRIKEAFNNDPKLGLICFYGSRKIDKRGWDQMSVSNIYGFDKKKETLEVELTDKLVPVLVTDSLFMAFRRELIPLLDIKEDIGLCHFYDKIWPMRLIDKGYRVAMLGVSFQHQSGATALTGDYFKTAEKWYNERGVSMNTNNLAIYDFLMRFEGMIRYHVEFKDIKKMIPAVIDKHYKIKKI